ncbi:retinol dehydrogenase 14-like [Anneissia japonica]|uniref:retinol dehydrogenase 14-like n=1 Tax=Anneissia japonica TaxID=1529436 RepID=UPI0014254B22|nr:retinol dehydrogenase 14-like [Anneissia japonica]
MAPSNESHKTFATVGIVVTLTLYLIRRRFRGATCKSLALMQGKTVIITGANTGIGRETALSLAVREARVILACRDVQKGENAAKYIRKNTPDGEVVVKKLDLASMKSIREFAEDIIKAEKRLDVLINNAGIFQPPLQHTEDGFELQFGVNHLGHFLLTNLLLDSLKQTEMSRIVIVSSSLHKRGRINFDDLNSEKHYHKGEAYNNSKLANVMFARELHRRLAGSNVSVYCLHPGVVNTNLGRYFPWWLHIIFTPLKWLFFKTATQGAQTTIQCAVAGELTGVSGHYYGNCKEEPWDKAALDDDAAKKLWEVSEQMTKL